MDNQSESGRNEILGYDKAHHHVIVAEMAWSSNKNGREQSIQITANQMEK
jgi:hypothetical protein